MLIIGLVVIAAAATFGIEIAALNNTSIDIDAFNQVYETSVALVFVAGVVTALAGAIGVMLVRDGLVRRRRARREAMAEQERRERHIAVLEEEHAAQQPGTRTGDAASIDLRSDREASRERDHVTTF